MLVKKACCDNTEVPLWFLYAKQHRWLRECLYSSQIKSDVIPDNLQSLVYELFNFNFNLLITAEHYIINKCSLISVMKNNIYLFDVKYDVCQHFGLTSEGT